MVFSSLSLYPSVCVCACVYDDELLGMEKSKELRVQNGIHWANRYVHVCKKHKQRQIYDGEMHVYDMYIWEIVSMFEFIEN